MRRLWIGVVALVLGCSSNTIELDSGGMAGSSGGDDLGTTGPGPGPSTTSTPQPTTVGPNPTTVGTATTADTGDTGLVDTGLVDTGFDTGFITGDSGFTGDTGFPGEVSFFAHVAPILQERCAPGCHEPGGEWAVQDLLNSPYFALVDVPSSQVALDKVEPGSLDLSYMWHKLNGTHPEVGGVGDAMPKDRDTLDEYELEIIATWILDGAPNN